MASVSSSHLILFIASLLIAASVAGTFTQGVQRLSSALGDRSLDVSKDVRTDVEIISDSGSVGSIYDNDSNTVTVLVKNTGSLNLEADPDQIDVVVDGQLQTDVNVAVADGETWMVGNVAQLDINLTNSLEENTDHRVRIIVNGDEETLQFRT